MHVLKVILLLALTLGVMRVASWTLGWLAFRCSMASQIVSTLVGNSAALALFVGFLVWNLMPGEPFDLAAAVFGVVVFATYQALDLKWCPWRGSRREANNPK